MALDPVLEATSRQRDLGLRKIAEAAGSTDLRAVRARLDELCAEGAVELIPQRSGAGRAYPPRWRRR